MFPAQERLDLAQVSVVGVDHRLVEQPQFVARNSLAQGGIDQQGFVGLLRHGTVKKHMTVPPLPFGVVHGGIGQPQQVTGMVGMLGKTADPGTGRQHHRTVLQFVGFTQPGQQGLGLPGQLGAGKRPAAYQHDKFVSSQPVDLMRSVSNRLQATAGFTQQLVAGFVSPAVIDALEKIEVDQDQRHPFRLVPHLYVNGCQQGPAVGQSGHAVVIGIVLHVCGLPAQGQHLAPDHPAEGDGYQTKGEGQAAGAPYRQQPGFGQLGFVHRNGHHPRQHGQRLGNHLAFGSVVRRTLVADATFDHAGRQRIASKRVVTGGMRLWITGQQQAVFTLHDGNGVAARAGKFGVIAFQIVAEDRG